MTLGSQVVGSRSADERSEASTVTLHPGAHLASTQSWHLVQLEGQHLPAHSHPALASSPSGCAAGSGKRHRDHERGTASRMWPSIRHAGQGNRGMGWAILGPAAKVVAEPPGRAPAVRAAQLRGSPNSPRSLPSPPRSLPSPPPAARRGRCSRGRWSASHCRSCGAGSRSKAWDAGASQFSRELQSLKV